MTTQWKADAYKAFCLSEAKKNDCKRIAMILVHEALRHYQKFDDSVPRGMDSKRWKPIKTSNNVTVYRERNSPRRVVKDSDADSAGWQMPRVIVGNGTIADSMDDLLFGLANGDEAAILQNVSYSGLPVNDAQILSTIEKPTLEHPYRCTVLQYNSVSLSPVLRGVVKDRDAVYIRATGVLQVGKGERIGYNLMHSIDLPSTSLLKDRSILRARLSSCVLFKPLEEQLVEVFIKGYYEVPGNNRLDSIAAMTVAGIVTDSWASGQCAKRKKLSWLLQTKYANSSDVMGSIWENQLENMSECSSCKKVLGTLRKAYTCTLCDSFVCGKCVFPIELLDVVPELKLVDKKVRLCPTCDQFTNQVNSYKVARQEIFAGRYEKEGSGSTIFEPSRIYQLRDDSIAWSGIESCPGEVYELHLDQFGPSSEGSVAAIAPLTSSSDETHISQSNRKPSEEGPLERSGGDGEVEIVVENVWRGSISEVDLKDEERARQLTWLEMAEKRLRHEDVISKG